MAWVGALPVKEQVGVDQCELQAQNSLPGLL